MSDTKADFEKLNKELAARVKELEASLADAQSRGAKVAVPVPGKFTAELETPEGKTVNRTIRFKPGRINCAIPGVGSVPSEQLLKIANGKKISQDELDAYPVLRSVDQEIAVDHLTWLASVQAGNIEDA